MRLPKQRLIYFVLLFLISSPTEKFSELNHLLLSMNYCAVKLTIVTHSFPLLNFSIAVFNLSSFPNTDYLLKWTAGMAILNPSNPFGLMKNELLNDSQSLPGSLKYTSPPPGSNHRADDNQSIIHFTGNGSLTVTRALWYPPISLSHSLPIDDAAIRRNRTCNLHCLFF